MTSPGTHYFRARVIVFCLSTLSATFHALVTLHLLSAWRLLLWDTEAKWETTFRLNRLGARRGGTWNFNRATFLKLVWVKLVLYFSAGAVMNAVGMVGALKRSSSLTRRYRNYAIADLCVSTIAALSATYVAICMGDGGGVLAHRMICDELAFHPNLLRQLGLYQLGVTFENCEPFLERVTYLGAGFASILLLIRMQFVSTIDYFYRQILHEHDLYGRLLQTHLLVDIGERDEHKYKRI